jgi:hypothetical protein
MDPKAQAKDESPMFQRAVRRSPRVLLERLRLTDQDLETIRSQTQETRKVVKQLWRPHEDHLEISRERVAADAEVKEEPSALQTLQGQDQFFSQGEPGKDSNQADVSGPLSSRYCRMSSFYLELEAKQEQEKSRQEEERLDEDKEVDVETVTSELHQKPEFIFLEEDPAPRPIC